MSKRQESARLSTSSRKAAEVGLASNWARIGVSGRRLGVAKGQVAHGESGSRSHRRDRLPRPMFALLNRPEDGPYISMP
jgi:hypothetical protein